MREWLQKIQIRWPVVALVVLLVVSSAIVIIATNGSSRTEAARRENDVQITLSRKEQEMAELQKNVDSVGKNAYIESKAREEGMIREGELIFRVENPERLDCYTMEEWQILTNERQIYAETGGI